MESGDDSLIGLSLSINVSSTRADAVPDLVKHYFPLLLALAQLFRYLLNGKVCHKIGRERKVIKYVKHCINTVSHMYVYMYIWYIIGI